MSKISAVALTCVSDDYHYMVHNKKRQKSNETKRDSNSKNQVNKNWQKVFAAWSNDAN